MHADHFQPEKLLAAGPASKVYRGVEAATGRKVLIKVLLEEHETTHSLDREQLQLLAPSLMQMRHPQIAGLITLVPTEDEFTLIYEFMPGMNARTFAVERKPTATDVRALAVQLMHALLVGEHLRQPHGDLKPSNLIIADHPGGGLFLQVQDWGLSLARTAHPPETLWFRAPELHAGGTPTLQSDLFTAAASLFCIATNTAPAPGDTVEQIMNDWHAFDIRVLSEMRPDLDQPLCQWLGWLMQLDPGKRPQTVAQALDGLMTSMHPGFIYMPQQAPAMAPGSQTTPLITNTHPNAPRPKPITPKNAPATSAKGNAAAASSADKPVVVKKSSSKRMVTAVVLNVCALGLGCYFLWPILRDSGWGQGLRVTVKAKDEKMNTSAAGVTSTPPKSGLLGRYVRVEIPGKAVLNLAEVQIFSGTTNIAIKGTASQSSIDWDGKPELAIDGNTNGDKGKGNSVMHTDGQARSSPWWQVDLGSDLAIQSIILWNRTDGEYGERSKNMTIKILDAQQKLVWEKKGLDKPNPSLKIDVGS